MLNRSRTVLMLAGVVTALLTAPAPAAWVVTLIPMQPGWSDPGKKVEVYDINSNGVVCGAGNYVVNVSATAFRYDGTTLTELPFLPDAFKPWATANAINADGVACGFAYDALGRVRAVYWDDTSIYTIPYPEDANTNSEIKAYDINDSGVIVGRYSCTNGVGDSKTAFYYENGSSYSLRTAIGSAGLFGGQTASGINNNGIITGSADADLPGVTRSSFTYDIATGIATDIGNIGYNSSAVDINESGQIIGSGQQTSSDKYRAVTYDDTWHLVDSAVTNTNWGRAINDNGRMVGTIYVGSNNYTSWYSDVATNGSTVSVDIPTWQSVNVQGVNNNDWMAGYGRPPGATVSELRGFILSPPPGDADHDGDIDIDDYAQFAVCMSGPQEGNGFVSPSADCLKTFDFAPADGDVDLKDFAAFQETFEGS